MSARPIASSHLPAFRGCDEPMDQSGGKADVDQMLDQALVFLGSGLGSSDFD